MSVEVPENLLYTEEHEWLDPETGWMGITDFAQGELGDVVYVELPDVDREVESMEPFLVVESVKAVSDVYAPADGRVAEVNDQLEDHPENVNDAPYGEGRMVRLEIDREPEELMEAEAYRQHVA